jgi:hypothetical protein
MAQGWRSVVLMLALATTALADEPLRERIDRAIESKVGGHVAGPADDGEFVRRVYLDLHGMTPSSAEARAFLDDPDSDKRERLIDRLLDRPEFARHLANVLDLWLMERRASPSGLDAAWRDYLLRSARENTPFDRLVREVLAADGLDSATRPAARFLLDREAEPHQITRDVGRVLLGRDMQCAQRSRRAASMRSRRPRRCGRCRRSAGVRSWPRRWRRGVCPSSTATPRIACGRG